MVVVIRAPNAAVEYMSLADKKKKTCSNLPTLPILLFHPHMTFEARWERHSRTKKRMTPGPWFRPKKCTRVSFSTLERGQGSSRTNDYHSARRISRRVVDDLLPSVLMVKPSTKKTFSLMTRNCDTHRKSIYKGNVRLFRLEPVHLYANFWHLLYLWMLDPQPPPPGTPTDSSNLVELLD